MLSQMSVTNYHYTQRNSPEERSFHRGPACLLSGRNYIFKWLMPQRINTNHTYLTEMPFSFVMARPPPSGRPSLWASSITLRRSTLDRTPLDEWSAHHRDIYQTTHNTHDRHQCSRRCSNPESQQASGRRGYCATIKVCNLDSGFICGHT